MNRFQDKVVIVTGACGSIGSAVVKRFFSEGAKVVLADIKEGSLLETAARLSLPEGRYLTIATDVTDETSVCRLIEQTVAAFGRLDVMFNNAGIVGAVAELQDFPTESLRTVLDVNVMGVFYGIKYALRVMLPQKHGVIINTSSVAGHKGMPNTTAYVASKHAIMGLTRIAAAENARRGVRVCAVCPAPVDTPMMAHIEDGMAAMTKSDINEIHDALSDLPMGRYATPDEVAAAVLFLASDDASYVNGSSLFVDGGLVG